MIFQNSFCVWKIVTHLQWKKSSEMCYQQMSEQVYELESNIGMSRMNI